MRATYRRSWIRPTLQFGGNRIYVLKERDWLPPLEEYGTTWPISGPTIVLREDLTRQKKITTRRIDDPGFWGWIGDLLIRAGFDVKTTSNRRLMSELAKVKCAQQDTARSIAYVGECEMIQIYGVAECKRCWRRGTKACGGRQILKTGKNSAGCRIGRTGVGRACWYTHLRDGCTMHGDCQRMLGRKK